MDQELMQKHWLEMANRYMDTMNSEFPGLNRSQLQYKVHLHNCSIRELLNNLNMLNDQAINAIEGALRLLDNKPCGNEYVRGLVGVMLLKLAARKTFASKFSVKEADPFLLENLNHQQERLKELIKRSIFVDINKKLISFGFFLKVSTGNMVEYILECQRNHLMMARRILMLQNL